MGYFVCVLIVVAVSMGVWVGFRHGKEWAMNSMEGRMRQMELERSRAIQQRVQMADELEEWKGKIRQLIGTDKEAT